VVVHNPPGIKDDDLGVIVQESRRKRARRLGRASWQVLRSDRRLLIFPLASVTLSLALGAVSFAVASGVVHGSNRARLVILLGGLLASYPVMFVTTFSGVALAAMLFRRIDGIPATPADGWRAARARIGVIARWSLFACTIGTALRLLQELLPLGGKIAAFVLDVTWMLASLFAVPILAYDGFAPRDTLRRSVALLRVRWGEQLAGNAVIVIGASAVALPAFALILFGLGAGGSVGLPLIVAGGALLIAAQAFSAALNQVFRVFLYRSVRVGGTLTATGPFRPEDLADPFHRTGLAAT
jgi:hypothetical protein